MTSTLAAALLSTLITPAPIKTGYGNDVRKFSVPFFYSSHNKLPGEVVHVPFTRSENSEYQMIPNPVVHRAIVPAYELCFLPQKGSLTYSSVQRGNLVVNTGEFVPSGIEKYFLQTDSLYEGSFVLLDTNGDKRIDSRCNLEQFLGGKECDEPTSRDDKRLYRLAILDGYDTSNHCQTVAHFE